MTFWPTTGSIDNSHYRNSFVDLIAFDDGLTLWKIARVNTLFSRSPEALKASRSKSFKKFIFHVFQFFISRVPLGMQEQIEICALSCFSLCFIPSPSHAATFHLFFVIFFCTSGAARPTRLALFKHPSVVSKRLSKQTNRWFVTMTRTRRCGEPPSL